ncbi:MAG: FtsK/SpoIIIE domain-containing protein [Microcella sp.]|uniref:FtsK/SpoIIIE domain-containing protein n=1 Tax=Microcella sp. TaxID=1913979 RepID=UPI0027246D74|nr:FtsK/SpoIIIE domain-containing protein [Microcella sp.]MDO8338783.1 FtsK/SpoIIIE domain-containing protein [Microcella sp.]
MTALVMPPLPAPPSPPPRTPFPVIAVIAPAIGAVAILLITGSVFVLVFAALSPLIAIATALDARRTARRHLRDEAARFDRDCTAWLARVPELHALERARADAAHPPLPERLRSRDPEGDPAAPIRIGVAPAPSAIAPERPAVLDDGPAARRLAELTAAAATHPALPVLVPAGPIRIVGRGAVVDSIARLVALHPACVVERVASASSLPSPALPSVAPVELVVETPTSARLRLPDGRETLIRPEAATRREHDALVRRRAPAEAALPDSLPWAALASATERTGAAPGPIGVDADGVVELDLLGEAPHALVGGTTGSGKSELLRTVALAWAASGPPAERSILLVDFKGGSAFAELSALPHVVGLLTDLDAASAERALRSLRAEIRRREGALLARGARDIADLPVGALARLLILVDEYAVLVESFPELQALVADLAARGRSLGIHLLLCTQRPGGVVRDAVAANCGIRLAFRMASASDASGLLPVAPPPDGSPAGRAVLAASGRLRTIHVATIAVDDIAAVGARWRSATPASRPWLPPLPARVSRHEALELDPESDSQSDSQSDSGSEVESDSAAGSGAARRDAPARDPWAPDPRGDAALASSVRPQLLLGAVDDPDRQRRVRGEWAPHRDGALLVVGARGSGAADALAVIAESASASGCDAVVLPDSPADVLGVLGELRDELDGAAPRSTERDAPGSARVLDRTAPRPLIVIVPEIDALVAEAGERALDLLDAIDAVDRRLRRRGGSLAASCSSVLRSRSGLVGRFDSVLLLRAASPDDHRAAGGAPGDYDAVAPSGRGRWRGRAIQLLAPESRSLAARSPRIPVWEPSLDGPAAVVSARPAVAAERLRRAGVHVATDPMAIAEPDAIARTDAVGAPRVAVADAESWQSAWSALALARREGAIVLADASESDARAVLGARASIPLRDESAVDEIIVVDSRGARRARWPALVTGRRASGPGDEA